MATVSQVFLALARPEYSIYLEGLTSTNGSSLFYKMSFQHKNDMNQWKVSWSDLIFIKQTDVSGLQL